LSATLMGVNIWAKVNTSCNADPRGRILTRYGASDTSVPGLPQINGDPYFMMPDRSSVERIVYDTQGLARALLPPYIDACVYVNGWTVDTNASNIAAFTTAYSTCANVATLCYNISKTVNVTSPLQRSTGRTVYTGGAAFGVPWPPYSSVTVDDASVAYTSASAAPQTFSEWCATVLFWYAVPDSGLCAVSGSVDRSAVGLVSCLWVNPDAGAVIVQQCGMLNLWRTSANTTVASQDTPNLIRNGTLSCQLTRRCVVASLLANVTAAEWALNSDLSINSVYYSQPSCLILS
jgi:hypothetical protein